MAPTLFFLSLLSLLSLRESLADKRALLFTSNATKVEVGESIKLKCELENYTPANEYYYVYFYQDSTIFCDYYITRPDSTGHRTTTFDNDTSDLPSLGRQPVSSTFPVYEITVTPTVAGTSEYYCNLYHDSLFDVYSKHLSLTVTPPFPKALLTSNVTTPVPKQPFTVTCTFTHFTNFTPLPVDYSVIFASLTDGQLATFEVTGGKALLSDVIHTQVGVFPGPRSTFPTFDLVLTEKGNATSVYWCDLEETGGKALVRSESWPALLTFKSIKSSESQRLGTCAVGAASLNLTGKVYSVQFWSDLGPKSVNLLAEYAFRPNLIEEFKSDPLAPWTSIRHGSDVSWPVFSILANGTGSLHGAWWCALAIGAQGTPDYREFKSNKVDL